MDFKLGHYQNCCNKRAIVGKYVPCLCNSLHIYSLFPVIQRLRSRGPRRLHLFIYQCLTRENMKTQKNT